MLKTCYFEPKGTKWVCVSCGIESPVNGKRRCEKPRDLMQCVHLGDRFDNFVTAINCGCSTAEARLTVFECAVHKECLPTYRRGELSEPIQTCRGCNDYLDKNSPN